MSGPRKTWRDIDGVVLLDKPLEATSNAVLQRVRRLYQARKAGHTGSLDPLASGLLPLCFGEATKFTGHLLDADKAYRFTVQLGVTTASGDAAGEVIERRPVPALSAEGIEAVLARHRGPITQVPPMYSALKHQGQRLYELARQGVEVERAPRPVVIHALELHAAGPDWLELGVRCSKGTYVRSLAQDIGEALGCGGYVTALRRTGVAPWWAPKMVTLDALEALASTGLEALDALLLPVDAALEAWPVVELDAGLAGVLGHGQAVRPAHPGQPGPVRLYGPGGRFLGVGEALDDGRVAPRRLLRGVG